MRKYINVDQTNQARRHNLMQTLGIKYWEQTDKNNNLFVGMKNYIVNKGLAAFHEKVESEK